MHVWLYAWPSATVVRSLRIGQKVPLKVLDEQTTSSGQYAFSVNPAALPGKIVNMEVAAFGGGGMTASNFTRQRVSGSGGAALAMLFDRGQMAPEVANMRLIPRVPANPPKTCLSPELVYQRNLGGKWVVVGGTYSKARNITATFTYTLNQSSSLGVGLSASSSFGDFHADGTYGITTGFGEDFPPIGGARSILHRTVFRYGLFRWRCAAPHAGSYWANYQSQPIDSAAGASDVKTSSAFRAVFCVWQEPNSAFHLYSTAAYTFSGGVSIAANIGINLSSETGYDHGAELSYAVNGNPGRWMCGKSNNPGGQHPPAGLVVAH